MFRARLLQIETALADRQAACGPFPGLPNRSRNTKPEPMPSHRRCRRSRRQALGRHPSPVRPASCGSMSRALHSVIFLPTTRKSASARQPADPRFYAVYKDEYRHAWPCLRRLTKRHSITAKIGSRLEAVLAAASGAVAKPVMTAVNEPARAGGRCQPVKEDSAGKLALFPGWHCGHYWRLSG